MLKKIGLGLVLVVLCNMVSLKAESIGFLDMGKVTKSYKKFEKFEKKFEKKAKQLDKELEKKKKRFEEAKKKGYSKERIESMKKEFDEELKPRIEEIEEDQRHKMQEIKQDIIEAARSISKSYGIDVVLQKGAVIDGGFDLTTLVIEKLNK